VKYMANSPAKNMSSLDSHTTVPTETMLGRFRAGWGAALGAWVADVTGSLCPEDRALHQRETAVGRGSRRVLLPIPAVPRKFPG
jgi:hypothetical protein